MDDEGVVVVTPLTLSGEVFAVGLQHDDITAIDQTGGDGGALGENTMMFGVLALASSVVLPWLARSVNGNNAKR